MKFILFDIDGTLIDSGGAGTKSLNLAFEELFSIQDGFKAITMAGKTDVQIIKEGLKKHDISSGNGIIPRFCNVYIRHLKQNIAVSNGSLKPGIRNALSKLHAHKDVILGLLTGNIEEGARLKLDRFDLNRFFEIGAFGSDHEDRNSLLPLAVHKLEKHRYLKISPEDCIVIGDTPRDVDCTKPYGAFSVAVATGPYSFASLSHAGADLVLRDLADINGILQILISSR